MTFVQPEQSNNESEQRTKNWRPIRRVTSIRSRVASPTNAEPPAVAEQLAAVAHDLRLPLSHIKGFVSALRRTDAKWDADTRQEFLADIETETDRMADLIESLIEVGSTYRCPPTPVDAVHPKALIDGAARRLRGLLAGHAVHEYVADDVPLVRVNVSQMERVLANLLQNAIKYTPPDTPIDISIRVTQCGEVLLLVEDRGPGVPPAHTSEIFEPLVRGHHTTGSAVPGHGLGLAICHSIVLSHGGRMAVTDRPGGGASFSVFLPLPAIDIEGT